MSSVSSGVTGARGAPSVVSPTPSRADTAAFARFGLIGESGPFRCALQRIERLARYDAAAMIYGETGTGKELAARAMHYLGPRREGPFVPVNCGAIPEALVESELFGHVRGAFTDARDSRDGFVAQAERGTLLLDEIEALGVRAQVALLRFLQDREYRPVGGKLVRNADVRVIGTSNCDLKAMVAQGRFRADLLFRLDVLTLHMPSLRSRGHDVVLLAEAFARRFCCEYGKPEKLLAPGAAAWLAARRWPGNVRELENLVHRAVVLCDQAWLDPALGDEAERGSEEGHESRAGLTEHGFREAKARVIAEFERAYIVELLARAEGNLSLAARLAGKERSRLGRLVKKYGLERSAFTPDALA